MTSEEREKVILRRLLELVREAEFENLNHLLVQMGRLGNHLPSQVETRTEHQHLLGWISYLEGTAEPPSSAHALTDAPPSPPQIDAWEAAARQQRLQEIEARVQSEASWRRDHLELNRRGPRTRANFDVFISSGGGPRVNGDGGRGVDGRRG